MCDNSQSKRPFQIYRNENSKIQLGIEAFWTGLQNDLASASPTSVNRRHPSCQTKSGSMSSNDRKVDQEETRHHLLPSCPSPEESNNKRTNVDRQGTKTRPMARSGARIVLSTTTTTTTGGASASMPTPFLPLSMQAFGPTWKQVLWVIINHLLSACSPTSQRNLLLVQTEQKDSTCRWILTSLDEHGQPKTIEGDE